MEIITADKARILLNQEFDRFREDLVKELNEKVNNAIRRRENHAYIDLKYQDQIEYIKTLGYKVERFHTGFNEEELKISW